MNVVFADAFYFIARLNRRDQHHSRVVSFSRNFRGRLLTTDWIMVEVADALAASECRPRVHEFLNLLRNTPLCEVIPASRELLDRAIDLHNERRDKQWTLTDCASFVSMRDRQVFAALTADHHFEQAGFEALLKSERPG